MKIIIKVCMLIKVHIVKSEIYNYERGATTIHPRRR